MAACDDCPSSRGTSRRAAGLSWPSADQRHPSTGLLRMNTRRLPPLDEILPDDIRLTIGVTTYPVSMSQTTADSASGPNRITHGAARVLAYLHERDAICSILAQETDIAESSAYRWLTELDEAGILEAEATQRDNGRPVVRYHLPDEELGEAAQVIMDRLG